MELYVVFGPTKSEKKCVDKRVRKMKVILIIFSHIEF